VWLGLNFHLGLLDAISGDMIMEQSIHVLRARTYLAWSRLACFVNGTPHFTRRSAPSEVVTGINIRSQITASSPYSFGTGSHVLWVILLPTSLESLLMTVECGVFAQVQATDECVGFHLYIDLCCQPRYGTLLLSLIVSRWWQVLACSSFMTVRSGLKT